MFVKMHAAYVCVDIAVNSYKNNNFENDEHRNIFIVVNVVVNVVVFHDF